MGTCFDPQVNCDTCFEVLIGDCLDDINLSLGLTPSTLFFFRLIDKFGATYNFSQTTDGSGDFTLDRSQLPDGLINQFAGEFQLQIFSDSGRTELVNVVQNSITYNCVLLVQELSNSNSLTPPDVFSNDFSFLFDGVDEFFNIDSVQTALSTTTTGAMGMWIKPVDSTPLATEYLFSFGDTNADEILHVRILANGTVDVLLRVAGVDQWRFNTNSAPFTSNTWHNIFLVQNGIPVFYVDAIVEPITFTDVTAQAAWFSVLIAVDNGRIGCNNVDNGGNTNFFSGNIDEVLFLKADLLASQITSIHNLGVPKDESDIFNGVSYFRMGDKALWDGLNWTMIDQIGSNDSLSTNMEFSDKVSDTPP